MHHRKVRRQKKERWTKQLCLAHATEPWGPCLCAFRPTELQMQGAQRLPFEHSMFCSPRTHLQCSIWQVSSCFRRLWERRTCNYKVVIFSPRISTYLESSQILKPQNCLPCRGAILHAVEQRSHLPPVSGLNRCFAARLKLLQNKCGEFRMKPS